jgi:hypothetical protein
VAVMQRLKELDDRLARDRDRERYDSVRPWWVYYSGLLLLPLMVGLVVSTGFTSGVVRPILFLVFFIPALTLVAAALAWRHRHRV